MIFFQFLSIMLLLLGIVVIMILEYFDINKFHPYVTIISILSSMGSIIYYLVTDGAPKFFGINVAENLLNYSNSLLVLDQFTAFFAIVFTGIMVLVIFSSITDLEDVDKKNHFVYYTLMIFVTIGMILVSSAIDLAALVVSWELVSIPSYLLVAFMKRDRRTSEAAIKFFIIGSISSALMLFGSSFLYGISGSTNIYAIMKAVVSLTGTNVVALTPMIIIGLILVLAGLGFKMGIVPFQWWLPDTYEGAMTSITTMLAAASKKVGFAAGFRVLTVPLLAFGATWNSLNINAQEALYTLILVIAIVTMIVGNIGALAQTKMKRLLAYSSIGQAGYLLLALGSASLNTDNNTSVGLMAGLFHSGSHAIMTAAAFICVLAIFKVINSETIEDYKGLRQYLPKTSMVLTISLLGLAGIPPLIGFWSKFFVFFAAIDAGNNLGKILSIGALFYIGAFVAIMTSAISVFYYVKVVKYMMVDPVAEEQKDKVNSYNTKIAWNISLPLFISFVIIIFVSLAVGPLIDYLYSVTSSTIGPILKI